MTRREKFLTFAALLGGVLAFGSSFGRTSSGQMGGINPAGEGRYRMAAGTTTTTPFAMVTDSVSGHTWIRLFNGVETKWADLGSPVPER